jgi:hypothetical protein
LVMGFSRDRVEGTAACSFHGEEREVRAVAARLVAVWEALQDQGRAERLPERTQASLQAMRAALTGDLHEFQVALQRVLDWVAWLDRQAPDLERIMNELRRAAFPPYVR